MNGRLVSDLCPKEEYSCFMKTDEIFQCGGVPVFPSQVCKECEVRVPITGRVVLNIGRELNKEQITRTRIFPMWVKKEPEILPSVLLRI